MSRAWIALGSNLGEPASQLEDALAGLAALESTRLEATSPWYRTAPVGGPGGQPDFLNAVCRLDTGLTPESLLAELQRLEHRAGRQRRERWGPRTLDLDIILYSGREQNEPSLTLPHPRAHERAFVLLPLADLDPDLPLHDRPVRAWLAEVTDQPIKPYSA